MTLNIMLRVALGAGIIFTKFDNLSVPEL